MQTYEIVELWVSKSCSMALVRTQDVLRETDRLYLAHVQQHWIQPLHLLHARQRTHVRTGRTLRSEIYRMVDRMVVLEQQGERMQLAISSDDMDHRCLHFTRRDPAASPMTRQFLTFLERLPGREGSR
jgi:hypothetical protein